MKDVDIQKEKFHKLIKSAQSGDFIAIEELIKYVQMDIYTSFSHLTCNKDDIADLTQEVLTKIYKKKIVEIVKNLDKLNPKYLE